jgi:hypothetical protein
VIETLGGPNVTFSRFEPFKRLDTVKLAKVEEKSAKCGICKRACTKRGKNSTKMKITKKGKVDGKRNRNRNKIHS